MARAYIESDVEVDLCSFDVDEIIEHLEGLGYAISTSEQINKLYKLYTLYNTMPPEFFEKQLKEFFSENLNINVL